MEQHYTVDKPLLIAIDVGIKNIGICIADYTDVIKGTVKIPSFEFLKRSLLETQDKRIYKQYEESVAVELVYNFLHDHWRKYFGRAFLVLVEKQMCSPGANAAKERACVIIETAIKSFLYNEIASGGPRFYIIAPATWKGEFGLIEKRSAAEKKKITVGNVNPFRLRHKDASRELFLKIIEEKKDPCFTSILEVYGRAISVITTDEIEAFFMANYYIRNKEKVWEASTLRSHHNVALTIERFEGAGVKKRRLKKDDRNIKIEKFSSLLQGGEHLKEGTPTDTNKTNADLC